MKSMKEMITAKVIKSSNCLRVTIPKRIEKKLELRPGDFLILKIEDVIRLGTITGSLI